MKGRSLLIVGLLLLSGFVALAALFPGNSSACFTEYIYVNGTRVYSEADGANPTVAAPGNPQDWAFGQTYTYNCRVTCSGGCADHFVMKWKVLDNPAGFTISVEDGAGLDIDNVQKGPLGKPLDYTAIFKVTCPTGGTGFDADIKLQCYINDEKNEQHTVNVQWLASVGLPNVLPDINLDSPAGGTEITTGETPVTWTATDTDAGDQSQDLSITLERQAVGETDWTTIANGLKNTVTETTGTYTWDTSRLPDGEYLVRATVTDARNGKDTSVLATPVIINNPDPPEFVEGSIVPNEYTDYSNEVPVEWEVIDNDEADENLLIDIFYTTDLQSDEWINIVMDTENDGEYLWDVSDLPDNNNYMMKFIAEDTTGQTSTAYTPKKFIINNADGPIVKITYPRPGATLTGKTDIYWEASDDEDSDNSLKIALAYSNDDGATWVEIAKDEKNDLSYTWDTTTIPDGTYKVKVSTLDSTLIEGAAVSDDFVIFNNDAPTAAFKNPTTDTLVSGTDAAISWLATDEETPSGDLKVTLEYKGEDTGWITLDDGYQIDNTDSFIWDTTELDDGEYELRLTVADENGGKFVTESGTFSVYNPDSPIVDILSPITGQRIKGEVDIRWDAIDEDGDTLKIDVEYSTNGVDWQTIVSDHENIGLYRWDSKTVSDGDFYLRVVAKDSEFEIPAETGRMTIDNSVNFAPSVTITSPDTKDMVLEGTFEVTWSATDIEGDPITISLYYSSDKGSWNIISGAENIPNTGSFNWDTTQVPNDKYYVKVKANDGKLMAEETSTRIEVLNTGGGTVDPTEPEDDGETTKQELSPAANAAVIGVPVLLAIVAAIILVLVLMLVMKGKQSVDQMAQAEAQSMTGTATPYAGAEQLAGGEEPKYLPPGNQ